MPIELAERSSPNVDRSMGEGILPETPPFFAAPFRTVVIWSVRRALRRGLRELAQEPRLLNDIGLSREQVLHEAAKPFWRV